MANLFPIMMPDENLNLSWLMNKLKRGMSGFCK
jgi:hypothetical protein